MQRLLPLACGLAAVIAAGACGARSTMFTGDEDSSVGGSTGNAQGGSIATQTSNVTGTSVVTSGTTTPASSSTGADVCDNSGDCQICAECAQFGPCNDELESCFSDADCQAFAECFGMCQGTPGCFPNCAMMHPMGAELYIAMLQCILCNECPVDCEEFTPPQLCDL